jgi:hypothetical protein
MSEFEGKAENICSARELRLLTPKRHQPREAVSACRNRTLCAISGRALGGNYARFLPPTFGAGGRHRFNKHFLSLQQVALHFLVERFTVFGFEFQYWMPIFAALVAIAIAFSAWLQRTD